MNAKEFEQFLDLPDDEICIEFYLDENRPMMHISESNSCGAEYAINSLSDIAKSINDYLCICNEQEDEV